jgi:hypothetical protein
MNMANDSPLDDSNSGESELSTNADSIHNDSFSDLVHGDSDSADNPRAAVSTTHCFTDKRYDKHSTLHVWQRRQRCLC